jgi:hypothetical protein
VLLDGRYEGRHEGVFGKTAGEFSGEVAQITVLLNNFFNRHSRSLRSPHKSTNIAFEKK